MIFPEFSSLLLWRPVFALTCSLFLPFCVSPTSMRHGSVSQLSGGEQGRDPVPRVQLDWVVWEVWVVLLSPLLLTVVFFFLWGFSNYLPLVTTHCLATGKSISFEAPLWQTRLPRLVLTLSSYQEEKTEWHASAWFRQQTHGMWVWGRVPVLTGRGCLASYSNLNVLMV